MLAPTSILKKIRLDFGRTPRFGGGRGKGHGFRNNVNEVASMSMNRVFGFLFSLAVVWASAASAAFASEPGWLGVSMKVKGSGSFWSPVVASITIDGISPNSPAEEQHLAVGDTIVAINGVVVSGGKAREIKSMFDCSVGDVIHLELMHVDGSVYAVDLVAARRPR